MILVDSSVWIDHFHSADERLVALLQQDLVGTHPLVIEELAAGSIKRRAEVLAHLGRLRRFPMLSHDELMEFVERRRLWGRGIGPVDLHLLGSVLVVDGATLWTRDRRLKAAAEAVGVGPGTIEWE